MMPDAVERSPRPPATEPYSTDTSLPEYMMALWRRKWLLFGASLLCGSAAFAVGKMSPAVYEASVKMVVPTPRAGDSAPTMTVPMARAVVENQSLAAQIVREFHLESGPAPVSPQTFLSTLVLETPRDSNTLVVRVRLANRELPSKVANRIAELASDLAQRLSQDEAARNHDYIKAQFDQSQARLDATEARLVAFRRKSQIEALKRDVDAELTLRAGLLPLEVDIAAERASVARAEEELSKRQPLGSIRRTIDRDPALMEAAKQGLKGDSGVLGLELKDEYPNRVYEDLDRRIAEGRTRLSGLEKRRAELINLRKPESGQLQKLNLLDSLAAELGRLEIEHDMAKRVYLDAASRYGQVQLQAAVRSTPLQVLDAAVPPDGPIGPRVRRNTAVAAMGGFMLTSLIVLFLALVSPRATPETGARSRTTEA
jgi:succinoglycan biosynthesis transport protein ExoP